MSELQAAGDALAEAAEALVNFPVNGTPIRLTATRARVGRAVGRWREASAITRATAEPEDGSAFFAKAMAEHGRCTCDDDRDGCEPGEARCALCNVLPEGWPCPTPDHVGYPPPAQEKTT